MPNTVLLLQLPTSEFRMHSHAGAWERANTLLKGIRVYPCASVV